MRPLRLAGPVSSRSLNLHSPSVSRASIRDTLAPQKEAADVGGWRLAESTTRLEVRG